MYFLRLEWNYSYCIICKFFIKLSNDPDFIFLSYSLLLRHLTDHAHILLQFILKGCSFTGKLTIEGLDIIILGLG